MNNSFPKFDRSIYKKCKKLLKNLTLKDYINYFGYDEENELRYIVGDKNIILTSSYINNYKLRQNMVDTLKGLNYCRDNNSWCEYNVIPFLHEVLSLQLQSSNIYKEDLVEISKRYNVPINRLNTQAALFIRNYENGFDKFNIDMYFSKFDIYFWKYRDPEKLQKDLEDNRVSEEMTAIAHKFYLI